jgi:hypothetical protein
MTDVSLYVCIAGWIVSVLIAVLITLMCIRRTDDVISHKIHERVSSAPVLPVVVSDIPSARGGGGGGGDGDASSKITVNSSKRHPLANRFSVVH